MGRHAGAAVTLVAALAIVACSGGSAAPTAPTSTASSNAPPTVRSITVHRPNIEAGHHANLVVTVEDAETPAGQLRYEWAVLPAAGRFVHEGPEARWHAPENDPVPASYTFTVTVIESYVEVDGVGRESRLEHRVTAASPPVSVNDARRELRAHSEAFLSDLSEPGTPPDICARNFADSCAGKQNAVQHVAKHRATYSSAAVRYEMQYFLRSVEWPNCTAPDGSARCALLVYAVDWTRTRRADGVQEQLRGTEVLRGIYERNRWWLCDRQSSSQ